MSKKYDTTTHCMQCNRPLNPVHTLLAAYEGRVICMTCVRKNHRAAVKGK